MKNIHDVQVNLSRGINIQQLVPLKAKKTPTHPYPYGINDLYWDVSILNLELGRPLILSHKLNLSRGQLSDVLPAHRQLGLPIREELMEMVPVLFREGPMHGRWDVHHFVGLIQFGTHQLSLQHWKSYTGKINGLDWKGSKTKEKSTPFDWWTDGSHVSLSRRETSLIEVGRWIRKGSSPLEVVEKLEEGEKVLLSKKKFLLTVFWKTLRNRFVWLKILCTQWPMIYWQWQTMNQAQLGKQRALLPQVTRSNTTFYL